MTPKNKFNALNALKVIKEMEKRNIEAFYCDTKENALKKALELIPIKSSIAWGGSQSIEEIGLIKALYNGDYTLYDRENAKNQDEVTDIFHKAFNCDYYLLSTNAFTCDGKLINIDGNGNRVAAMIYGPKNVLIITGMNKLEKNEESAMLRARNNASVINAIRLERNTPCTKTGSCNDCTSEDCICCQVVVTRMSRIKNRIKVILVGEELGY